MQYNFQFIEVPFDSSWYWKVVRCREVVLRLPLGMRFVASDLRSEVDELIYAIVNENNEIIATNQFQIEDTVAKMRQVATIFHSQGKGFGSKLYIESEHQLSLRGVEEIYCHARRNAAPFYTKLGFDVDSEEFLEVGIPHVLMRKNIRK